MTPRIDWITDRDVELGRSVASAISNLTDDYAVSSLVPPAYESYARVFHPFNVWNTVTGAHNLRSWREVASLMGQDVEIHGELGLDSIVQESKLPVQLGDQEIERPDGGALPPPATRELLDVLKSRSGEEAVVALYWNGGQIPQASLPQAPHKISRWRSELRDYVGLRGRLDSVAGLIHESGISPSILMQVDQQWCVSSDIDLFSTYLGGSELLISEILCSPGLETCRASIADSIALGEPSPEFPRLTKKRSRFSRWW